MQSAHYVTHTGSITSEGDKAMLAEMLGWRSGHDATDARCGAGARFIFRRAEGGQASFAAGILELAAEDCDVIVDDVHAIFRRPKTRVAWDATAGFNSIHIFGIVLHRFCTYRSGNPIMRMSIGISSHKSDQILSPVLPMRPKICIQGCSTQLWIELMQPDGSVTRQMEVVMDDSRLQKSNLSEEEEKAMNTRCHR